MPGSAIDKVVVLARGLGTRMRRQEAAPALDSSQAAAADTGIKAMIPIGAGKAEAGKGDRHLFPERPEGCCAQMGTVPVSGSRPFLDYVLAAVADAGYGQVCLVIGPEQEAIRRYYQSEVAARRLKFAFATQAEPRGTADAVAAAEVFAAGDQFVVINSDNLYPAEALRELRQQPGCSVALFERDAMLSGSNVAAERVKGFAIAAIDGRGCLARIIEKPDDAALAALPKPIWLSMNCWRFGPSIFEACRSIGPSPRGELELPTAVQYAMDRLGETFRAVTIRAPVLDLTSRADIGPVSALLANIEVQL